jgi:hypothetical protein
MSLDKDAKKDLVFIAGTQEYIDKNSVEYIKIPQNFHLRQNYPNPFNPVTNLVFELPRETNVTVDIYNILGQRIMTLIKNKEYKRGIHKVVWNGRNESEVLCASGVYLFIMHADGKIYTRKGVLTK